MAPKKPLWEVMAKAKNLQPVKPPATSSDVQLFQAIVAPNTSIDPTQKSRGTSSNDIRIAKALNGEQEEKENGRG